MNSGRAEKNAHVRAIAFFFSNRIHVAGAAPRMRTARRANAKPGARVNDATAPHTKHTKNLRNAKFLRKKTTQNRDPRNEIRIACQRMEMRGIEQQRSGSQISKL